MNNPYETPRILDTEIADKEFTPLRIGIFLLNFVVASLFMMICVTGIFAGDTGGTVLSSAILLIPFAVYALCEWVAGYRQNLAMERRLGVANLAFAGFVGFGVITNVGEALLEGTLGNASFLIGFALVGTLIVTYLAFAGWMRLRWTRGPLSDARR